MEDENKKDDLSVANSTKTSAVTKQKTPQLIRRRNTGLQEGEEGELRDTADQYSLQSPRLDVQRQQSQQNETEGLSEDETVLNEPSAHIDGTNPAEAITMGVTEEASPKEFSVVKEPAQKPYSAFTKNQRWMIVIISSIAGIFSPISSTIYAPAIPTIADQFGKSIEAINLTVTMYLIFHSVGRRPVYISTLFIYVIACIGLALTPTSAYWLLMVLRCLQATGGSAVIAIGSGCIGDIATPEERGGYIGLFSAVSMAGPAVGPVLGGIMAFSLSWRWIFWLLAITCGINLLVMFMVLPETLRTIVGDGSIPPPFLNARPIQFIKQRRLDKTPLEKASRFPLDYQAKPERRKFDPFGSFRMLFYPDVAFMLTFSSLLYVEYYWVLTTYSTLLKENYGYNDIQIGLCYLPNGIGAMATSFVLGKFLNWDYVRSKAKAGYDPKDKVSLDGFPIEATRLRAFPWIWIVVVYLTACIGLGWAMESKANVAVALVMNFFIGGGLQAVMGVTSVLLVDLFPGNGGAITASFNLCRCLSAAALVSAVDALLRKVGAGWTYVIMSGIVIAFSPCAWLVVTKGPQWRKKRTESILKEAQDKSAKIVAKEGRAVGR